MVNGPIIPTPGAVMKASKILKDEIGDLVTIDVWWSYNRYTFCN